MTPQMTEAVARLALSRERLRLAMTKPAADTGLLAQASRLVREHPLAAAGLAAAVGALLTRVRPWRWLRQPALLAALLPGLMAVARASSPTGTGTGTGLWASLLGDWLGGTAPPPRQDPAAGD